MMIIMRWHSFLPIIIIVDIYYCHYRSRVSSVVEERTGTSTAVMSRSRISSFIISPNKLQGGGECFGVLRKQNAKLLLLRKLFIRFSVLFVFQTAHHYHHHPTATLHRLCRSTLFHSHSERSTLEFRKPFIYSFSVCFCILFFFYHHLDKHLSGK